MILAPVDRDVAYSHDDASSAEIWRLIQQQKGYLEWVQKHLIPSGESTLQQLRERLIEAVDREKQLAADIQAEFEASLPQSIWRPYRERALAATENK